MIFLTYKKSLQNRGTDKTQQSISPEKNISQKTTEKNTLLKFHFAI